MKSIDRNPETGLPIFPLKETNISDKSGILNSTVSFGQGLVRLLWQKAKKQA
jgi:hypothetical protein